MDGWLDPGILCEEVVVGVLRLRLLWQGSGVAYDPYLVVRRGGDADVGISVTLATPLPASVVRHRLSCCSVDKPVSNVDERLPARA